MTASGEDTSERAGRAADDPPAVRLRLRAELRAVPAAVWALSALQLGLLLCYSVLMPVYRAPDEPQNFDIAMAANDLTEFTGDHRTITPMVRRSYPYAGFSMLARRLPVPPSPPAPRGERPSFAGLDRDAVLGTPSRNQQWQHPPLYPALLGTAVTVVTTLYPPAHDLAFDQTVGLARALTTLLVAPLPLLAFLAARRLSRNRTIALTAATLPLAIPQLAHIGSAVNHDNLLIALVGLATVAVAFVARGDASLRTATTVGVLGGLALLAKGFGLFMPAWIGAVYLLAAARRRRWRPLLSGGYAVAVATAVGAWWWLRNLSVHGTLQPTGVRLPQPPPSFTPDAGWWLGEFVEAMVARFWGHLGWYQARLPGWAITLAAVVLVAALVAAFAWRRSGAPTVPDLLVMAFPTVAIGGIVAYGGWHYYASTSFALGLQGRYLFPGLAGLAVVVATGLSALPPRVARWAPVGVLVAAAGLHTAAVRAVLAGVYDAGDTVTWGQAVRAVAAWSPWPGWIMVAGLAALVAAAGAVAVTLRGELRPVAAPPAPDRPAVDPVCAGR